MPPRPPDARPAPPDLHRAPRARWVSAALLLWPVVAAVVCLLVLMGMRWAEQHGAGADGRRERWWTDAYYAAGGVALYTLVAGALLALVRVPRAAWRGLVAATSLVAVPVQVAAVRASPTGIDLLGLFVFFPRLLLEGTIPEPSFTSACTVPFWRVRDHGFYPAVSHAIELSDGSVLLVGSASRVGEGTRFHRTLARLTADGRPDTAFAYHRGCLPEPDPGAVLLSLPPDSIPGDVLVGPGGTFSAEWDAREARDSPRVQLRVAWSDTSGRALGRPPVPARDSALPQFGDPPFMRPTPGGGYLLAGRVGPDRARGGWVGVVRVLADGRPDPAFTPWQPPEIRVDRGCAPDEPRCTDRYNLRDMTVESVRAWPDGRLLVLVAVADSTRVLRLGADGRPDSAFNRRAADAVGPFAPVAAITIDAAGRPVLGRAEPFEAQMDTTGRRGWRASRRTVLRLRPDGSLDPTFPTDSLPPLPVRRLAAQPSGHVLAWYDRRHAVGPDTAESALVRLDSAGRRDRAFEAGGPPDVLLVRRDGALVARTGSGIALLAPDGRERRRTPLDLTGRRDRP